MSAENNVPAIRFNGFSGEWEESVLDVIAEVLDGDRGHNYPNGDDLQATGHTLFLSASNVTANGFKLGVTQYINEEKSNCMGNGKLVLDDIILTSRGSVGYIAWYNEYIKQQVPFARIHSGMLILRPKNHIAPSIVAQFLKSPAGKKKIDLISFGSAQPQLTKMSVSEYTVTIPSEKTEQTKIGNYFQQLDTLIAQHQQKHDKLLNLKKALLEKMFPKQGTTVPEIRFKGFSGEWRKRPTIELCSISTGKNNTQDKISDGKYSFYVRSAIIERSNNYLFDEEAVLTVGDGVGTGKVYHYVRGKYDLHQRVYRMYDFNGVTGKYFYYYFSNNFFIRVMSMTAKTSVDSVRLEMISNMLINLPSIEEQKAIASFLENLDTLIIQYQAQLKKLNNIKQACLEKMFA